MTAPSTIVAIILILAAAVRPVICAVSITQATKPNRYRARVAYDGHGFHGFQLQSRQGSRTVQGVLEGVVNQRFLGDPSQRGIKVVAAGRTDTGVHARGQAIHFDLPTSLDFDDGRNDLRAVEDSLNKMLPTDVRIWNLQQAPPLVTKLTLIRNNKEDAELANTTRVYDWNVMFDATKKLYSYRLSLAPVMDPLQRYYRWHPTQPNPIDVDDLQRVLRCYEGVHNFRAFAGAVERNAEKKAGSPVNTFRTVYAVDLIDEKDGNYRIDFLLKGALYRQVRSMVGTALDVCRGKISESELQQLLRTPSTREDNKSKPAPPEGLTLEHVYFDDPAF